jgi:wyosine [tRNA(Phe)-imidazoG37] synthetase (radical SAM superfamily)
VERRLDFRDHRRELGANRYVYAVVSRRARGLSIGVNLNPDKACNFDCPYCQVDRTTPGGAARVETDRLRWELETTLAQAVSGTAWERPPFDTTAPELRRVSDVAFAGDGEPTLAAGFPEAARLAREVRDALAPGVPLRLLTNATLLHAPRVGEALASFDALWCKLDAGSEDYFRIVDGTGVPLQRVLENLLLVSRERPIVIQSLFFAFDDRGPGDGEIAAWASRLRALRAAGGQIDHVQVYTVARRPADPRVAALPPARLEAIAARARAEGVRAEVYGGA